MKRLSHWLLLIVLAVGIVAPVVASEYSDKLGQVKHKIDPDVVALLNMLSTGEVARDMTARTVTVGSTSLSATEAGYIDGQTPGTVTASKAVVVDADKGVTQFGTLGANILRAGAASQVGAVEVYAASASSGKLNVTHAGNSTNNTTTITNDAHGQTTVTHLGDPGVAASYLLQSATELGLIDLTAAELDALDGNGTGVTVVDGTLGYVTVDMTNVDSDITYTAVAYGTISDAISITHIDPAYNSAILGVEVDASAITINLATDEAGAITTTAADIKTLVNTDQDASALVTAEDENAGAGVVNALAIKSIGDDGTSGVDVTPGSVGSWRFKADGSEGYVKVSAQVWKKFSLAGL